MFDLSIIIVNYNAKEFLKKCLISIVKNVKNVLYEIIVVDNNSSDNSSEMVKKEFPQIKLIANKKNGGFSKANNQGIKVSQKSRYVLFLNPDTIVHEKTIEEMIKFMDSHPHAGATTCKLVMPNGEIDDASHRGFPTPWNSFCHFSGLAKIFPKSRISSGYNLGWMNFEKIHEIDALAGAFMLVRRSAGEEARWWDEDYFFYGEDIDFCFMLKQKGWKIYYVPTVFITHYKGVSGGIKAVSKEITTASEETKKIASHWRFEAMRI
ncbi:MAG: glycosyltransferase family 2 protein, partial [Candidatus Levybacteria bacterium]|nr:glycosyltransferase family 2 protein [Candidatus Levybacteria bacterium]